tara:strand:+ start:516 stop:869 length:354 start_codon:yes stop_codon:yes gene_type:complete
MVKIYVIIDVNGLKYVGKTTSRLNIRLNQHRNHKKYCSSQKLDLNNCEIYLLQECSDEDAKQREYFWIQGLTCVNQLTGIFNKKEYKKKYNKEYRLINKEKLNQYQKEYKRKNKNIK